MSVNSVVSYETHVCPNTMALRRLWTEMYAVTLRIDTMTGFCKVWSRIEMCLQSIIWILHLPNRMDIYFLFYSPNPVILLYVECSVCFVVGMQTTVISQKLCALLCWPWFWRRGLQSLTQGCELVFKDQRESAGWMKNEMVPVDEGEMEEGSRNVKWI
jgi:hypothetical protein